jgi:hypothetical protein
MLGFELEPEAAAPSFTQESLPFHMPITKADYALRKGSIGRKG